MASLTEFREYGKLSSKTVMCGRASAVHLGFGLGWNRDPVRGLETKHNHVSAIIQDQTQFQVKLREKMEMATIAVDCVNGWRCASIWYPVTGSPAPK